MQHAGGASRASMLRRRGAGTLLVFGDQSAALAPIAMSPSRRSSAHGLLGVSSSVQAQPLPWLAYFGLDGAHDLI